MSEQATQNRLASYRERVQLLCEQLQIKNPITEDDLTVARVDFFYAGAWHNVAATSMNMAGRAFFQFHIARGRDQFADVASPRDLRQKGELHFDLLWDDAEEAGRTLIAGLKRASEIRVHWKH